MQKCSSCGVDLPDNARFCGECGSVQGTIATDATTRSNTPQLQPEAPEGNTLLATRPSPSNYPTLTSATAWSPNALAPETPLPLLAAENEGERRKDISPWSPLYDAAVLGGNVLPGSGQAYTPGVPAVQGTPQVGHVPGVPGSPTISNPPVTHPVQAPPSTPSVSHPVQQPPHPPITHPVQPPPSNPPVSHPVQQPPHPPVTHPVQGPPPTTHPVQPPPSTHQPPEQPGNHEHHRHHRHHIHHGHHLATRIAKLASLSAKTTLLVVTAVVVVAAGGIAAAVHILARPQPLISITSNYQVDHTPAGTNGTILHISGQKFSSNSAITFLLDGHVAPGNAGTRSDSNGTFSANVTITDAWNVGTHTLTARDASNYSPKNSVRVTIVQQGQASTPGPDGAPPDDASFQVIAQIQGGQATETEIVTGHPDPRGGTVCQADDNGQPVVTTNVTTGAAALPAQRTRTLSCAGNYKGGTLSFTETLLSDVRVFSLPDGTTTTCTLKSPQTDEQLSGSYTGNTTFSGTITYPTIPDSNYSCQGDGSYTFYNFYTGSQVNWTGQVTDLHP